MRRLSPLAFAAAMIATGGSVLFAAPSQAAAMVVHYSDLDLATAAGRTALDARIDRAAQIVCGVGHPMLVDAAACRRESVARAQEHVQRTMQDQAIQLVAR